MARFRTRKIGRCPNCCPDGGAVLHKTWDDNGSPCWKCMNCHHVKARRTNKAAGKPTSSQEAAVARLAKAFGVAAPKESQMIGRKLWVQFENPARKWYDGQSLYGTIGVTGKLEMHLPAFGTTKTIKDAIDIKVYLEERN